MSAFDLSAITAINANVNKHVFWISDPEHYGPGKPDWWTSALAKDDKPDADDTRPIGGDGKGDCEDIAIAKIHDTLTAGWPRELVNFWTCSYVDNNGQQVGHAVESVIIDGQEWVCDVEALNPMPVRAQDLNYKWYTKLNYRDGWSKGPDWNNSGLVVTFTPAPVKT